MSLPAPLAPAHRTGLIIGATFLMAQPLFVVMAMMVDLGEPADLGALNLVFPAAAVGAAVGVFVARRLLIGGLAMPLLLGGRAALRPVEAEPMAPEEAHEALSRAAQRYSSGHIIGLASAEAVTLMGLAHGALAGDWRLVGPYVLVSVGLIALQLPTRAALLSLAPPGALEAP